MDRRQERLERQRLYQQRYRAQRRREKAPGRDDIARALLHFVVTESLARSGHENLVRLIKEISQRLEEQGFSPAATRRAWQDLIIRYGEGWAFQRKVHLRFSDGLDEETTGN